MSNTTTSYLRIRKRDGADINLQEQAYLIKEIVNANNEFGSYWIMISKQYFTKEKYLDIQFGSGKRTKNVLEDLINYEKYEVWERYNDDSGKYDEIFTYEINETKEWVTQTTYKSCLYGFDRIKFNGDFGWLDIDLPLKKELLSQEININGFYNSINSRTDIDVEENTEQYGPLIQYNAAYTNDYSILNLASEMILSFVSPTTLQNLNDGSYRKMRNNTSIEFYWQNRVVLKIEMLNNNLKIFTADYWDNCVDEDYLNSFVKTKLTIDL
jgi:hypothetical protein